MGYIQHPRRYKPHSLRVGYIYIFYLASSVALSVSNETSRDLSILQDIPLSFLTEKNEIQDDCKEIIYATPLEISVRMLREYTDHRI